MPALLLSLTYITSYLFSRVSFTASTLFSYLKLNSKFLVDGLVEMKSLVFIFSFQDVLAVADPENPE